MPRADPRRPTAAFRFAQVRLGDPVARIRGVRILCVAVVGDKSIGDKSVARQQTAARSRPLQIGMLEAHSGVEIGDHYPGAARSRIPGSDSIDGTRRGGRALLQIPLL